ncbi:MAG: dienelactone hydrolase [Acidimicrobiia bacterium]|nr:dienelactone hydrolase [Acidimicrobiia bacterium]MDH4363779.1 dienelactone hydrolase [Acidimicrobiia bacterium]MDH5291300.1 dienelactone hydrolase [Acidimicrobiia bacterium]
MADQGRAGPTTAAGGLILFHGAGGDREHHTFLALEAGLDVPVARVNFPYRARGPGRRPPDRMPKLVEAVAAASAGCAAQWGVDPGSIVLGGRSMGGRAASIAVADGAVPAWGLVLLSYPLHPPGKPANLRVEHLRAVTCPVLLIQGNRDPFGTPAEFARELLALGGPLTELWLDATHDPVARHDPAIVSAVSSWLSALSGPSRPG